MKTLITDSQIKLWLSANDTYEWAHRAGAWWPCSDLSGKRLFAEFDSNGLVDLAVNGRDAQVTSEEFNAITSDFLRDKLPQDHPAWFVTVGQFTNPRSEQNV